MRILAQNRWPWRLHATYDETIIARARRLREGQHATFRFEGLQLVLRPRGDDQATSSIERIAKLGGGIAIQHRMAYQGEYFVERYGHEAAEHTPPIKRMMEAGVKISAGTDATRVASYDPWVSLAWLATGKTLGGLRALSAPQSASTARRRCGCGPRTYTWFSNEQGKKGNIKVGQLADLAVLDRDYFEVAEDEIQHLQSVLTIVDGKPVYGASEFADLAPPPPPAMPDWSPVRTFGGYHKQTAAVQALLEAESGWMRATPA